MGRNQDSQRPKLHSLLPANRKRWPPNSHIHRRSCRCRNRRSLRLPTSQEENHEFGNDRNNGQRSPRTSASEPVRPIDAGTLRHQRFHSLFSLVVQAASFPAASKSQISQKRKTDTSVM